MNDMKIPFNKKVTVLWTSAIVIIMLVCWQLYRIKSGQESRFMFEPPPVNVSKAVFGSVPRYINSIGTLRPFDSVVIKSEVNAKVNKICFSEGALVKEGDLLIELDDASAKAQFMEAEAQYQKAKCEFEPVEKLADKGVMARVQRDSKKAEMNMAKARVFAYQTQLEKHRIHAPFGGIVGLREISKGQIVASGNDLLKIVDCHPIKVYFKVAEVDIEKVYVGQEIQVSIGGDSAKTYRAVISAIDPESDRITHSFDVRATLDVPENVESIMRTLRPGRFVSVRIQVDGDQQGIVIPESALEKIGDEDVLFRVVEGIAIRTLVMVGVRRDGNVEIVSGINDGDIVITSGQTNVLDGKEVSIKSNVSTSDIVKAIKEEAYNRTQNSKNMQQKRGK
ncbi:MAG: efflux RND transporter periplasmic adaptor subunit [Holosporaceae bacterium]|jgi:membrane fusion protein (multidrug efflux system)|nr:efflux RND transporter periplasmic adaptor subunit [Holosporaceae bacterium]